MPLKFTPDPRIDDPFAEGEPISPTGVVPESGSLWAPMRNKAMELLNFLKAEADKALAQELADQLPPEKPAPVARKRGIL